MVPAAGTGPRTQGHASAAVALPRPSSDTEGPGDAPWAGGGETPLPVGPPPRGMTAGLVPLKRLHFLVTTGCSPSHR